MGTLHLGVNIDHIATLRQARYSTMPDSKNAEPDPIAAASICERAGAHGLTAHLRAGRRHIQGRDMEAQELDRLCQCARHAHGSKLQVNAGHGINYRNIALIHKIPHLTELNIGHAIVSRAIFVGWENAVREMLALMENYVG